MWLHANFFSKVTISTTTTTTTTTFSSPPFCIIKMGYRRMNITIKRKKMEDEEDEMKMEDEEATIHIPWKDVPSSFRDTTSEHGIAD